MNTRQGGPANGGQSNYRAEDDRRRDEARGITLQSQVDEIRQALRELASRQVRLEESIKHTEGTTAQNRLTIDQIRQESQQSFQARALDENRTRQYLGELEQRIDDAIRPIRSLQAHVNELVEASRKKVDDSGQNVRRYEELKVQAEQLQAVGDRNSVVTSQLRDGIDAIRTEIDLLRRDSQRNEDGVKIVDQEARRKAAEMLQVTQDANARIDDLRSDIGHVGDLLDDFKRSVSHVDPALSDLTEQLTAAKDEYLRLNQQLVERHESLVNRTEDLRQNTDSQFAESRLAFEQRLERINERLEAINERHREVDVRLANLGHEIEELRLIDASIRRDLWQLHEQRVRLRLEQAQAELDAVTGQRRMSQSQPELPLAGPVAERPADR